MSRGLRFGPLMVGLLLAGCTRMETSEPTGFGVGKPARRSRARTWTASR
jgi:hypothetical protein